MNFLPINKNSTQDTLLKFWANIQKKHPDCFISGLVSHSHTSREWKTDSKGELKPSTGRLTATEAFTDCSSGMRDQEKGGRHVTPPGLQLPLFQFQEGIFLFAAVTEKKNELLPDSKFPLILPAHIVNVSSLSYFQSLILGREAAQCWWPRNSSTLVVDSKWILFVLKLT